MAINFPSSPALDDTYTFAGKTWKWNGSGWALVGVTIPATTAVSDFQVGDGSGNWIKKTLAQVIALVGGVTNGDSHDHNGGDGGTIAYPNLSSKPAAETNSNDIFRVDSPGGVSLWTGTISGTPSGTSVTVSAPTSGTEAVLVPTSTSQLGKMRLYNLTRSNSALISNYNTGTNVVTLTATVPASWANGDSLTIVSQTVSGGGLNWIDIEITSSLTGKSFLFMNLQIISATAGDALRIHPFETFATPKIFPVAAPAANIQINGLALVKMVSNVFSMSWTGTPTTVYARESGYLE